VKLRATLLTYCSFGGDRGPERWRHHEEAMGEAVSPQK